jgi:hypothetical protein
LLASHFQDKVSFSMLCISADDPFAIIFVSHIKLTRAVGRKYALYMHVFPVPTNLECRLAKDGGPGGDSAIRWRGGVRHGRAPCCCAQRRH